MAPKGRISGEQSYIGTLSDATHIYLGIIEQTLEFKFKGNLSPSRVNQNFVRSKRYKRHLAYFREHTLALYSIQQLIKFNFYKNRL